MHANIRNIKPTIQPKPISIGNTNFYTSNSASNSAAPSPANFDDTLSNGKNLVKPSTVSMPTIIKPTSVNSFRKPSPVHVPLNNVEVNKKKSMAPLPPVSYKPLDSASDESFEDEPPSPPMPTIPAPILVLNSNNVNEVQDEDEEKESYGIALYDFESDVTEDLSFRVSIAIFFHYSVYFYDTILMDTCVDCRKIIRNSFLQ